MFVKEDKFFAAEWRVQKVLSLLMVVVIWGDDNSNVQHGYANVLVKIAHNVLIPIYMYFELVLFSSCYILLEIYTHQMRAMFDGCAKRVVPHNNSNVHKNNLCWFHNALYTFVFFTFAVELFAIWFYFSPFFFWQKNLALILNREVQKICPVFVLNSFVYGWIKWKGVTNWTDFFIFG